jgi:hypothetical protein
MSSPVQLLFGTVALVWCRGGHWKRRKMEEEASSPLQVLPQWSYRILTHLGNCHGLCRQDGHTGEAHTSLTPFLPTT